MQQEKPEQLRETIHDNLAATANKSKTACPYFGKQFLTYFLFCLAKKLKACLQIAPFAHDGHADGDKYEAPSDQNGRSKALVDAAERAAALDQVCDQQIFGRDKLCNRKQGLQCQKPGLPQQ